jgi:hypothetical protein
MDLAHGTFSASGKASAGPFGGEAVVTNQGLGACIDTPPGVESIGVSWDWGDLAPSAGCPGLGAAASASAAGGSAAPRVKATVRGRGRRRSLTFRLPRAAGRRVTFAEQSKRVYRQIGTSTRPHGTLRFHSAPGPGGRRDIVAIVEQGGIPWAKLTVAHYKAPPTRRLRRPRRVVAKRRGSRLLVGWSRVRGARGYEARIALPRDGRRLLFFPRAKKHGLRVKGIEASDRARVSVAAIGPDLRPGRAGKAKLSPRRRQPRRRRRR